MLDAAHWLIERLLGAELASALMNPVGGWIVITGVAVNVACALVGCFLLLRRMSMMGDAIAHSVLPGLAVAFIITGSYQIGPLLIGAAAAGLLAATLTQSLHRFARVPSDASMGVVFTTMFALGVVLIKKGIHGVHFDVRCVYEGSLDLSPFFTISLFGMELPRALVVATVMLLVNASVLTLLWKEFKVSAFDPALATTMGFSASAMHYLLMALVAATAVASFEAVGAILVVAMLIVPAATAYLLTDRLGAMVLLASAIAALASVVGYVLGVWWDTNLAGMMTVAAGGFYCLAVVLAPRYGVVTKLVRNLRITLRVVREDLLAMLYRLEELHSPSRLSPEDARAAVGGGLTGRWSLLALQREGRIALAEGRLELTQAGRDDARQLVRSHRLWETYLVEHLGLPLDHVHEPAHRVEHYIDEAMREQIKAGLEQPDVDPHGREIPTP